MLQKTISILLITSLFIQNTYGFSPPDDETQCAQRLSLMGVDSPDEYEGLKILTDDLFSSDLVGEDEVKAVYRQNGCNPDVVNSKTSSHEFNQACEMEELWETEGCKPAREISKAIKNGTFTAKDYHSLKGQKNIQKSNILLGVGTLLVAAAGTYIANKQVEISKRALALEEKKYEDSKKAAEQANTPCKPTEAQKAPETPEPKTEPEQPHQTPVDPQTEAIRTTSVDQKNTLPDVRIPENPVVDQNPEIDSEWQSFNQEVQEDTKKCDLKKEAASKGISFEELLNGDKVRSNPNRETYSKCNLSTLKWNLLLLETKNKRCSDQDCLRKKAERTQKKQEEQRIKKEALHKCEMTFGGLTPSEKAECKAIQKDYRDLFNKGKDNVFPSWDDLIDPDKKNPFQNPFQKPSIPSSIPLPSFGGHL